MSPPQLQSRVLGMELNPERTATFFGIVVSSLLIAHLLTLWFRFGLGHPTVFGLVDAFDLDQENNVPTYVSSVMLLFAAILAWIIGSWRRKHRLSFGRHWRGLGLLLALLSLDEAASFHELLARPARVFVEGSGLLYFTWVVPGALLVLVVAVAFASFFVQLPSRTRGHMFLAGALVLVGGMGVEMFAGRHMELFGQDNYMYGMLVLAEEGLELAGIVLLVYSLLDYLRSKGIVVQTSATSRHSESVSSASTSSSTTVNPLAHP